MSERPSTLSRGAEVAQGNGEEGRSLPISALHVLWPVFLSLAVLAVVAYFTYDPAAFEEIALRLNGMVLLTALAMLVLRVVFGAWRINFLSGGRLGARPSFRIQIVWDFLAYVTPSTIGGGPFVPFYIARDRRIALGDATSIILFAMLLDQVSFLVTIPVLLVAGTLMEVIPEVLGTVGYWAITLFFIGLMLWVLLFAYATLFRPQVLTRIVGRVSSIRILRRFRRRVLSVMQDFKTRSGVLRKQPLGFYAKGLGLTVLPWLCRYALVLLIIWSVYPDVDKLLAFFRAMALSLTAVGLPTPGGAGGVEVLYAAFFGPPLMPAILVAPTLLAWRFFSYYIFIVAGSFIVMRQVGKRLRTRRR